MNDQGGKKDNYAPDFGLAIRELGVDTVSFSPFPFRNIAIIGTAQYSTNLNMPIDDVWHALTVDFDAEMLGRILALASDEVAQVVLDWLNDPSDAVLELPTPIECDITLRPGELQENAEERYLPMEIIDVCPKYGLVGGQKP